MRVNQNYTQFPLQNRRNPVNFEAQLPFLGLRMTVLLLIYSNTGELGSIELWDILKKFGINQKNMKSHEIFGNVERYVWSTVVL